MVNNKILPFHMLKLYSCNLWLSVQPQSNDTVAWLTAPSGSLELHQLKSGGSGEHAKAKGNWDLRPFICIGKPDASVLNKFAVYTSAPHLTFMSPFYAFITLDTADSANHVRSSLSATFRNIDAAPPKQNMPRASCPQLGFLPFSDTNIKVDYMAER